MKNKKIVWFGLPVVLIIIVMSIGFGDQAYEDQVLEEIEERRSFLKNSAESPFRQFDEPYVEPQYFEIDPKYRVNARVERLKDRSMVQLADSDGDTAPYTKYAWLHFSLEGQRLKLLVLKPVGYGDADYYFCAFADETSAVETYGAGRYLDIEIGKSDKTVLDFNLAYNPYCAYVDGYTCPLPPRENLLAVAIRAGEKMVEGK